MNNGEVEILEDRLAQMVLSAECAIKNCKEIALRLNAEAESLHRGDESMHFYNNPYISALSFTSNLYFNEAILVTSSILERGGRPRENSIAKYLQVSNPSNVALQALIHEFDQEHMREIRDTRVAHKDAKVDNGHDLYFTTYSMEFIVKLESLIEKIRQALMNDIGVSVYSNNYLLSRTQAGVHSMIEHLVEKYKAAPNRFKQVDE